MKAGLLKRNIAVWLTIAVAMVFISMNALAQMPIRYNIMPAVEPDSVDVAEASKKHFWRASAEVVGFNLGLWAFDRYVQHGDYAYISLNTIKENFKHGFKWDNDKLGTNTFLHPYNGNLYYTSARANGFNYWQSGLFAIAGSGMWEMFMEREYPSTNDFIATPIGGMAIGEMLYRASDAIIDERTTGGERFEREALCFLLTPMRGLNRLITGQAWRKSATSGRTFGIPNVAVRASLGWQTMIFQGRMKQPFFGATAQIDVEYGDRFEAKSRKPFDYFSVRAVLQGLKYQPVLAQVNIKGRLISRELFDNRKSSGSIGLYQHFDFYDSDTITNLNKVPYKLGIPASFGCGFMFRDVERRHYILDAYLHANAILLGSSLSDHYYADERCYNWASGFSLKGGVNIVLHKNQASLSLSHEFYRLFSWSGYRYGTDLQSVNYRLLNVMGDKSVASFNVTEFRLDFKIIKHLYGTLQYTNHVRTTRYRDFPRVISSTGTLKLMASYKF